MDVSVVTQLVSSVGFPIACCVALFYYMMKQDDKHAEEISKLTDALNNNTLVMQRLYDKLGGV